jgi:hypothetical protein
MDVPAGDFQRRMPKNPPEPDHISTPAKVLRSKAVPENVEPAFDGPANSDPFT